MIRQLTFNFIDGRYVLEEDNEALFSIEEDKLKFISLDFYNGIYRGRDCSATICLDNKTTNRTGAYIFRWIQEITEAITAAFAPAVEDKAVEGEKEKKVIPLYKMAACAGDGVFTSWEDIDHDDYLTDNLSADYAVLISGESMQPTIEDGNVVLVQRVPELQNEDIGIFVIDGSLMCKRYKIMDDKVFLCPDNLSGKFQKFKITEDNDVWLQGRVIGPFDA